MKYFINLIFINIKKFFSRKFIFVILVLFMLISLYKISLFEKNSCFLDFYLYSFFTSLNSLEKISELFIWSLYQFLFIGLISKFLGNEFNSSNIFYFIRTNSKFKWLLGTELTVFTLSSLYHFSAFLIFYIFYAIFNNFIFMNLSYKIIWLILSLILSSNLYTNLYMILIPLFKRNISSLLCIIFFIYISLYIGISANINKFLPFNQILSYGVNSNVNTLVYSNIYLLLFNIFLFVLYMVYVLKNDLTKIIN